MLSPELWQSLHKKGASYRMENRKTIFISEKQDNRAKESLNNYKWRHQLCEKWGTRMLHITSLFSNIDL